MVKLENEKKTKLGITLTSETFKILEVESKKLGLTKSQFISFLINKSSK